MERRTTESRVLGVSHVVCHSQFLAISMLVWSGQHRVLNSDVGRGED